MGYAIELPLDPGASEEVDALRRMLETAGIPTLTRAVGAIPHVSLGVFSDRAEPAVLERVMAEVADSSGAIELRLDEVDAFVEPQPVLYLKPAPSDALRSLHGRFIELLDGPASGWLRAYYRPESWQPHCTIAMEFDPRLLAEACALVRQRFSPLATVCASLQLIRFRPVEVLARRRFA